MTFDFEELATIQLELESRLDDVKKMACSRGRVKAKDVQDLVDRVIALLSTLSNSNAHALYLQALEDIGRLHEHCYLKCNEAGSGSATKMNALMRECSRLPIRNIEQICYYVPLNDEAIINAINSYLMSGDLLQGVRSSFKINQAASLAFALGRNGKQDAFLYLFETIEQNLNRLKDEGINQKQALMLSRFVGGFYFDSNAFEPKKETTESLRTASLRLLPWLSKEHYLGFSYRFDDGIGAIRYGLREFGEAIVQEAYGGEANIMKLLKLKAASSTHYKDYLKNDINKLSSKHEERLAKTLMALYIHDNDEDSSIKDLKLTEANALKMASYLGDIIEENPPENIKQISAAKIQRVASLIDRIVDLDPESIEIMQQSNSMGEYLRVASSTKQRQILKDLDV